MFALTKGGITSNFSAYDMTFLKSLRGRHLGLLCAVGGVPVLAMPSVFADDGSGAKKVKISQLPLYEVADTKPKYEYKHDSPSSYQESVSVVRKAIWEFLDSMQDTTSVVTDKLNIAKAHTASTITWVQEDPSILPKVGVITVAGLGGIVAGYRGGILRKVILSGSAMTAAAALCYPNEAVALTTEAYDTAFNYGRSLWEGDSAPSPAPEAKKAAVKESSKVNKSLEDHGQSKAEDKDMYTTRGK